MKIDTAKQLIRDNHLNFTEISDRLGYTSVHYFSRQFKKLTGMTPSEYATSIRRLSEYSTFETGKKKADRKIEKYRIFALRQKGVIMSQNRELPPNIVLIMTDQMRGIVWASPDIPMSRRPISIPSLQKESCLITPIPRAPAVFRPGPHCIPA